MLGAHDKHELTEVLVQSDENASFFGGTFKDGIIPGIPRPFVNGINVVAGGTELIDNGAPHAGIDQESHQSPLAIMGSTRSWPTTRRA